MLPRITSVLPPLHPVPFDCKWKDFMDISLADSDFNTPGKVSLVLGANVFSHAVLHGQWFSPLRTPSTFNTCFGCVSARVIHSQPRRDHAGTCYLSTTSGVDLLSDFIEDYNQQQPALSLDEPTVVEHFHWTHQKDSAG